MLFCKCKGYIKRTLPKNLFIHPFIDFCHLDLKVCFHYKNSV